MAFELVFASRLKPGVNNGVRMKYNLLKSVRTERKTTYAVKNLPGPVDFYEPNDFKVNGFEGGLDEYVRMIAAMCRRRRVGTIICNNDRVASAFRSLGLRAAVVYHEYDSRYLGNESVRTDNVVYVGSMNRTSLTAGDMARFGIEKIDIQMSGDAMFRLPLRCVHVDCVSSDRLYHHLHTSTKLATALALDAVFVANRVPVYVELLGNDYPLFFRDDLTDLPAVLERARAISRDPDSLSAYLARVRPVRDKLSGQAVCREYEAVFARYSSG